MTTKISNELTPEILKGCEYSVFAQMRGSIFGLKPPYLHKQEYSTFWHFKTRRGGETVSVLANSCESGLQIFFSATPTTELCPRSYIREGSHRVWVTMIDTAKKSHRVHRKPHGPIRRATQRSHSYTLNKRADLIMTGLSTMELPNNGTTRQLLLLKCHDFWRCRSWPSEHDCSLHDRIRRTRSVKPVVELRADN